MWWGQTTTEQHATTQKSSSVKNDLANFVNVVKETVSVKLVKPLLNKKRGVLRHQLQLQDANGGAQVSGPTDIHISTTVKIFLRCGCERPSLPLWLRVKYLKFSTSYSKIRKYFLTPKLLRMSRFQILDITN